MTASLERNLDRYRDLHRLLGALFWLPTSVLFFIDRFGLADALRLQAIYYLSVVVFEIPSGRMSDRVGRVLTLRFASAWWVLAMTVFVFGDGFWMLAVAQAFLAMGFAFMSGTVVTLHFDTLESLGRTAEFEEREATVRRTGLLVLAGACLIGGALALIDLRLPFAASLVAAIGLLAVTFMLVEPTDHHQPAPETAVSFLGVVSRLRNRFLAWVTLYVLGEVVAVHLTSELGAAYVARVVGESLDAIDRAPVVNGVLAAAVALAGAATVRLVTPLRERFGAIGALVLVAVIPALALSTMALVVSAFVLPLILMRSVQTSIVSVLVPAVVAPRIDRNQRATFLSMTSLAGRLGYGIVLLGFGALAGIGETLDWAAVAAVLILVIVGASGWFVRDA
jgi:MFS family permease